MTINVEKQTALSHERLCELLEYKEGEGAFYWRVSRRCVRAGDRAGRQHENGYRYIKIDQHHFMEHRLAWFYAYKEWPEETIDHKNRTKNSNNLDNFRKASYSQNQFNRPLNRNNKSGITGVSWCTHKQKWRATICAFGERKNLGYFDDPSEAGEVRTRAALELHGQFAA
jgi:hypothetical protein